MDGGRLTGLPFAVLISLAISAACVGTSGRGGADEVEGDPPALDDDDATTAPPADDDDDDATTPPPVGDDDDDDASTPPDPGPLGYIGGPCESVADCEYDGAVCLDDGDGFPGGHCSLPCEQYCPDADGYPVTFCGAAGDIPDAAADLGDGACFSRCDFGFFPESGCRPGYGCVIVSRANESERLQHVCLPGDESDLTQCHYDLAARGVAFEPTVIPMDHPEDHPELDCVIEDAVYVQSPVHEVDLVYYDGQETERVLAACNMAHALTDTIDDVLPYDVVELLHIGTYNCRVISGTDTLSRHGYADAIDIYGFAFAGGDEYTLVDDWEHDTDDPLSTAAQWLYDAGYRWYDEEYWNIILTPNYNAAHDNHFHVDLTPGGDYIGFWGGRYIGPAPYAD